MNIDFKKEKARLYQREYYKKNRQYHVLYHLRKRLISNINSEIKNMIDIREYAKLAKNNVQFIKKKRNYDQSGFKKITDKKKPILVYFD